jgi:hypothetical protein
MEVKMGVEMAICLDKVIKCVANIDCLHYKLLITIKAKFLRHLLRQN